MWGGAWYLDKIIREGLFEEVPFELRDLEEEKEPATWRSREHSRQRG